MGVFPVSLSETAVASAAFLECPIPLWNDLEIIFDVDTADREKLIAFARSVCPPAWDSHARKELTPEEQITTLQDAVFEIVSSNPNYERSGLWDQESTIGKCPGKRSRERAEAKKYGPLKPKKQAR